MPFVQTTVENRVIFKSKPFLLGFCACFCGEEIRIKRKRNNVFVRFKRGHNSKGENNSNWGGGKKLTYGYVLIYKPEHPFADCLGYVREHRLVVEAREGRYLRPEERVHHINGKTWDNRSSNLMLFANEREHKKFENFIKMLRMFNMVCLLCGSRKTYIAKNGMPIWHSYQDGVICNRCYVRLPEVKEYANMKHREYRKNKKKKDFAVNWG